MLPSIIEKLDRQLRKGLQSEAEVVYILVEVRKLLEVEQRKHEFEALVFHCDWAVHAQLSGATARYYLALINQWQHDNVTGKLHLEAAEELAALMGARRFREELRKVLTSKRILADVCNDPEWTRFIALYGEVISDIPLTIAHQRGVVPVRRQIEVPTYIDSVTVQKRELGGRNGNGTAFELQWNLRFALEPPQYKMAGWRMGFGPIE